MERAQRARWLKHDFDLSFPDIIDTMDGAIQIDQALADVGAAEAANARAEIQVMTEGGRILAYSSTVDNRTGDPVFQMPWNRD